MSVLYEFLSELSYFPNVAFVVFCCDEEEILNDV